MSKVIKSLFSRVDGSSECILDMHPKVSENPLIDSFYTDNIWANVVVLTNRFLPQGPDLGL